MPQYEHLPLSRLTGELTRRKRQFVPPTRIPRDANLHGTKISGELDKAIEVTASLPSINDVDPALILKVQLSGPISAEMWARSGLTVLAEDEDNALILFASDREMTDFKRRITEFQQAPPAGQKGPSHAYLDFVESIRLVDPVDRIGQTLRRSGFNSAEQFIAGVTYRVDIELWRPNEADTASFVTKLAALMASVRGQIVSQYLGENLAVLRVEANGSGIQAILALPEVASIQLPPIPDVEQPEDSTIESVGELPSPQPPADAPVIGVIDSGVNSGHPLLSNVVRGSFATPAQWSDSDERGHGTGVASICAYGSFDAVEPNELKPSFWIASAKIVDGNGEFDPNQLIQLKWTKRSEGWFKNLGAA